MVEVRVGEGRGVDDVEVVTGGETVGVGVGVGDGVELGELEDVGGVVGVVLVGLSVGEAAVELFS